jgi:hypothetical protein
MAHQLVPGVEGVFEIVARWGSGKAEGEIFLTPLYVLTYQVPL